MVARCPQVELWSDPLRFTVCSWQSQFTLMRWNRKLLQPRRICTNVGLTAPRWLFPCDGLSGAMAMGIDRNGSEKGPAEDHME